MSRDPPQESEYSLEQIAVGVEMLNAKLDRIAVAVETMAVVALCDSNELVHGERQKLLEPIIKRFSKSITGA